jgi:Spy/CpxP family protein refolding chaperone
MKSLKFATASVIVVLIAAVALAAEEGKPTEKKSKGPRLNPIAATMLRIERIKSAIDGLDLSQDQKDKLGKIKDDFEAKRQTIQDKLADLLTEDQKQAAKEAMDSAKNAGKKGREVYASVEASIKLTDEQKQKMEPIGKELQDMVKESLKQVTDVLTPEQKEKLEKKIGSGARKSKKAEKKD